MSPKKNSLSEEQQDGLDKIKSLQEMIATAERTITSAKQMLSQIKGPDEQDTRSYASPSNEDGQIVHGTFDGQIMIGEDGKQYPVPANYASKSKLVEGDMLKLNITDGGSFVYKQIGPAERKFLIGLAKQDERGNFVIKTEDKTYKVLLAAATYFKIEAGDEVTVVAPRETDSAWGAIENIVRKSSEIGLEPPKKVVIPKEIKDKAAVDEDNEKDTQKRPSAIEKLEKEIEEERKNRDQKTASIADEWMPDIEQLKKEAGHPVGAEMEN